MSLFQRHARQHRGRRRRCLNPLALDNQVCFALYRSSRALIRAYDPLLAPLGITYPQYLVMLVLWERDRVSVKDIGEKLALDSATLTPLLKKLDAQKIVTRVRDTGDARVVRIALTPKGRALRKKAEGIPEQLACLLGADDPAPILRLVKQLNAIAATLRV